MPTIHEKQMTAKKQIRCDDCGRLIRVGEKYWRLFGYAHTGDKPYMIRLHLACKVGERQQG